MSGKNRKQNVILSVISPRIANIPPGHYTCHIDSVQLVKGNLVAKVKLIDQVTITTAFEECKGKEVKEDGKSESRTESV
jgi:hypothetical protein